MGHIDATDLLLGCATIGWGACGAALLRRNGVQALGLAFLLGALLTGFDTLAGSPAGLPLGGLGMLLMCALSLALPQLACHHSMLLAAGLAGLLHFAHNSVPIQPTIWGTRPLDLAAAAGLAWLVPQSRTSHRWPLGCVALSLLCTGTGADFGMLASAVAMAAAPVPVLADLLQSRPHELAIATATSFAVTLALTVRATALARGEDLALAAIDDPLATIALVVIAFGGALLFASPASVAETTAPAYKARPSMAHAAPTDTATPAPSDPDAAHLTPSEVMRDLRNPLTSVLAAAHLAQTADADNQAPQVLRQLQNYGRQLSTAMADIEALEQLLADDFELTEEVFDLPALLNDCVAATTAFADDHDTALHYDATSTLPRWLKGDPSRLHQLFTRELHLGIERCSTGRVDVFASTDGDQLLVSLLNGEDGNPDPEHLGVVFLRELARVLGGEFTVRERSSGSEWRIRLPFTLAPEWEIDLVNEDEQAAQPQSPPTSTTVQGKVLLITDNRDHRHLIARMLASTGAEVATANNGEMALHMLAGDTYDLVLLDMQNDTSDDGASAVATAAEMRARGLTLPILAITSDDSPQFVEQCLTAGCNSYLPKPIDPQQLHGVLAMHLCDAE